LTTNSGTLQAALKQQSDDHIWKYKMPRQTGGIDKSCCNGASDVTRLQVFSSPLLLGYDGLEDMLERATKTSSDGYPPYNIERFAADAEGTEPYRISLAVAGFAKTDIEITVEDKQLHVRGKRSENQAHEFLHRGIANRQFAKAFLLADGMSVTGARLGNGLLAIDLRKSAPDRVVRRIAISE
jgi:HSP20 family molecular chaperone IbpA